MARLTARERKALPKSDYGVPSKAPGSGSYPMPDRAHAANTKARASRFASPAVRAEVDAKANRILHKEGPAHHAASHHHEESRKELAHGGLEPRMHEKGFLLGNQHAEHGFRRHPMK